MNTLKLICGPFVATILWIFCVSLVQPAVLPGETRVNGEDSKFEQIQNFVPSQLLDSVGDISELVGTVLSNHTSIFNVLKIFLEQLQQKNPVELNDLVDELLEPISSNDCKGHIFEWLQRVVGSNNDDLNLFSKEEQWVLQMIDAWGKLPEGILSGHITALGDFDECIGIDVTDLRLLSNKFSPVSDNFKGRYCTAYVADYNSSTNTKEFLSTSLSSESTQRKPELRKAVSVPELLQMLFVRAGVGRVLSPYFAVCMPNSCSQSDMQGFFTNALLMAYTAIPDVDPKSMPYPLVATCRDKAKPSLTAADIAMIILLSLLVSLSILVGIVDYWQRHRKNGGEETAAAEVHGTGYKYLMAFSFYTNTIKWLSTRKSAEDFGCLHGIRFFSTCWVVLAHSYVVFGIIPQWNNVDINNIYQDWTLMPIMNATFSVDTFFVMSGMLATYHILKMLERSNGKFNLVMFYIHRYLRLTPTYAILIGIMATLVTYVGNGPTWYVMEMQAQFCKDNWWTNLLYINNIVKIKEMCSGESWYLANDMQFYILSPLIVYPLWKWPKPGVVLLGVYTIASCISPVLIVHYSDGPPAVYMTRPLDDGFFEIYYKPWARIQTFLVGIWLGWFLYKTRGKRIRLPPLVVGGLWLLSTALALVVIFSVQNWFDPAYDINKTAGYFYAALSRFSWGLAISWIIFACIKGYGGVVNSFLSWKIFMPLGRLTFCVYLTSMHLQLIFHTRLSVHMKYDTYMMVNLFFAHTVMSFIAGYLCTILFESPFLILQKLIFEGNSTSHDKPQRRPKSSKKRRKYPAKRFGIFYENGDFIINTLPVVKEEKLAND